MIWEALTKLALLGTERGQLPAEVKSALEQVGVDTSAAPEQQLLDAAALYHQLRRAGFPLLEVPEQASKNLLDDPRHPLPARAARQLQHIVQGRYRGALTEFLSLLEQGNWRVPPEQLPTLFTYALKQPQFWQRLRPLIGPRGQWLLQQNPDWHPLAEQPPAEDWHEQDIGQQLMMLRYLRRREPEQALPPLRAVWPDQNYADKKRLLEELQEGLSEKDLPFLEEARNDRRKEVRQAAMHLLLLIPSSTVQQELFANAQQLLSMDSKGQLQVDYPASLTQELKQLGIGKRNKPAYAGGQPATWAYEVLSKVPPKHWESHFKRPTLDCMRLFLRGNRQRLLTDAVANAALLHQDHRWVEAILRHWWRTGQENHWNSTLGKILMEALPAGAFNDLLEAQFRQDSGYVAENSLAAQLLCLGAHDWSVSVSKKVILGLQERLNGSSAYHWDLWHYKRILKVAAFRVAPSLLSDLRLGWDKRTPVWERWAPDIDRFLKTLAFRADMYKNLKQ